jgi:hypothetical protein
LEKEKTVKISLGRCSDVVRRRRRLRFCAATCCKTIAQLAGSYNNGKAVCQTSPRFAELETCFNVITKKKKNHAGTSSIYTYKKKKPAAVCVRLFTLSLPWAAATAQTSCCVICWFYCYCCSRVTRKTTIAAVEFCLLLLFYSFFLLLFPSSSSSCVYSHPIEQEKLNTHTHTVYWISFEKISIPHFLIVIIERTKMVARTDRRPELDFESRCCCENNGGVAR